MFVSGWCFSPEVPIRSLAFVVDGERQPVNAARMPRLDPFRAMHPSLDPYATEAVARDEGSEADPRLLSYRSGFWGIVQIGPAPARGHWHLCLGAELEGDDSVVAELGVIEAATPVEPVVAAAPEGGAGPLVAIAMATYNPPIDLFARQLDSIRAQTHDNWICVISDDCSSEASLARIRDLIGQDPRFVLSRSGRRLGFYRNFERALAARTSERRLRGDGRSGRCLAPRQARDAAGRARHRPARLQRRSCGVSRRRADVRNVVESATQQPLRSALAAGR